MISSPFETSGSIGKNFKAVCDLHMRIAALSKALVLFDMIDVFEIIPSDRVSVLETKIQVIHDCQETADHSDKQLAANPRDTVLLA